MTDIRRSIACCLFALCIQVMHTPAFAESPKGGALAGERYRVLVSTDIGGTDPDDFQSMVHLLVYADVFDLEGLVSSPYGPGRKQHILEVIDCYEKDYASLKTWSNRYPTPDALRAISKQGETEAAPYEGVRESTEGSQWIITCARRDDSRPLYVLVWGGIEDLAQALHDAPEITQKLRVYFIGGPNKKWSCNAYQYIVQHHPELWIIEANSTYRGWFNGGDQSGGWGNKTFAGEHLVGRGALGDFFHQKMANLKMGDTPSVGWLLVGDPTNPHQPGWGGQFVRTHRRPYQLFSRITSGADHIELFGVAEFSIPVDKRLAGTLSAQMVIENQELPGSVLNDGTVRFRFCPKAIKEYQYEIRSNVASLNGLRGSITSVAPPAHDDDPKSSLLKNWWTDDPSPELAVGEHLGAKSVSQWRVDFLNDFAERMERCRKAKAAQ